ALEAERARQHFGGELLGVVAGDVLAFAEAVMLGEVAVQLFVARDGDADRRRDQPMGLARRRLGHDDEGDLARLEALHALRARENAAFGRKDAGDADEIAGGDAGRAQRELERGW